MTYSKALGSDDSSGFSFSQEMLSGDPTAAINFDRLQLHPTHGYIIFEYLLCDAKQKVTPFSSHPSRYWDKNKNKFIGLWKAAQKLDARLYLVNYAKPGTPHADKVKVIQVLAQNERGIEKEKTWDMSREQFKEWFRSLNAACLSQGGTAPFPLPDQFQ